MRQCTGVFNKKDSHWVGDGFPVSTVFSHQIAGAAASPFLLLDHAGPYDFKPKLGGYCGAGPHPHKGYEAVTIVYDGEVGYRDETGVAGLIGAGDVQWMTAGAGVIHEEYPSPDFSRRGGMLEMVQLWVNLPARNKSEPAAYQNITRDMIPVVRRDGMDVRVIAGSFDGTKGPARTFTSINVWDVKLAAGHRAELPVPASHNVSIVLLRGNLRMADVEFTDGTTVMLGAGGDAVEFEACSDAVLLILSGEPIAEPVVACGPFVMNSEKEIRQAIVEFGAGRFANIETETARSNL